MSDILTSASADRYRAGMAAASARLAERIAAVRQPSSGASISQLASLVDRVDLDAPGIGTSAAMDEVDGIFTEHAIWFHDSAYLAHLNCPVAIPAVVAEAVIAAVNPSLDTYDQSTSGTLIERRLIDWTAGRIGFAAGDGVFTSGGTQSNLHAMLLARESAITASGLDRSTAIARMSILATASSHFSVQKSALILGLPADAVELVPTDAAGRMDPAALRSTISALRSAGRIPQCVVATAGTTDRGCIDPIGEIAEVASAAGVWLHVDAAYGCGLLVSPTRRHLLAGIERADSVTVDFHKSFFQPVSSSAVLVRDAASLHSAAWHADYLNPAGGDEPNQVDKSLQTTRRFDALKLWTTIRAMGADEIGRLFDRVVDLTQEVHALVARDEDLVLVSPTQLSTVLFRFQPDGMGEEEADRLVPLIRRVLFESGRVHVARTRIDGRPCLKLTILNPETGIDEIAASFELVRAAGAALAERDAFLDADADSDAEVFAR